MTFDEIIGQEEFDRKVSLAVIVSLSEGMLRLGGPSLAAEVFLERVDSVIQREADGEYVPRIGLDPLQVEAVRRLSKWIASILNPQDDSS